ncbi:MAG: PQQ-binding-like beta-propeller repeat protein [Pirellulales bacterium]
MSVPFLRTFLSLSLSSALGLFAAFTPLAAQEWTRFRGPNGTGQSEATTIPTQWTEKDYNWKVELPGIGHGSPVIWEDKLFVASADPSNGTRMLFAVKTEDGQVIWRKDYPATVHAKHALNSFSSGTPACDANHVYFAWATPDEYNLLALDHRGEEVWRIGLGKFIARHGFGASPIVYEDLVIITNDQEGESFLVAVDRKSGDTRWRIPRKSLSPQSASYSTPMIYTPPGGEDELIVNSWAHGVTSHNPRTGEVNWEAPVFKLRTVGSPVLAGGLIWGSCGEGAGNNSVVAIEPGDKNGGKPSVKFSVGPKSLWPYVPTIIAAGDLVFLWGDTGIVTCVNARTRQEQWRERIGGTHYASPIRIGDRIFGISKQGEVVVLAASPEFKELARIQLGDETHATPAIADGKLFLRTQTKLMSIGGKNTPSN